MTPEEALRLAKTVADIYSEAVAEILQAMGRATARGATEPDWARQRLAELLPLRREAQRIVARAQAAAEGAVVSVVEDAYSGGRLSPLTSPGMVATNQRAVQMLARQTVGLIEETGPRVLRWTDDAYRQIIAETAAPSVVTGTLTRVQAAQKALDRFATQGVTGFVDKAGRNWALESYTEMATRTAAGQSFLAGTIDRFEENGNNLVIVSNSPEECSLCREYEGKLLSLDGVAPTDLPAGFTYMGTVADARDAGLFHPNCTHRIHAFNPDLTEPYGNTENPEGDRLRQRQRALERGVRDAKRKYAAAQGMHEEMKKKLAAGRSAFPNLSDAEFANLRRLGPGTDGLTKAKNKLGAARSRLTEFNTENDRKAHVSARRTGGSRTRAL